MKQLFFLFYLSLILSCGNSDYPLTEEGFLNKIFDYIKKDDPTLFIKELVVSKKELTKIYTDSTKLGKHFHAGKEINQLQEQLDKVLKNKHKFYALMHKRIPDWNKDDLLEYNYKYIPMYASRIPTKEYDATKDVRFFLEIRMKGEQDETFFFKLRGIRFKDGNYKLTDLLQSLSE